MAVYDNDNRYEERERDAFSGLNHAERMMLSARMKREAARREERGVDTPTVEPGDVQASPYNKADDNQLDYDPDSVRVVPGPEEEQVDIDEPVYHERNRSAGYDYTPGEVDVGGYTPQQLRARRIRADQIDAPEAIEEMTLEELMASGVPIGPTDAVTREVTDEELVSHHIGLLIDENSPYIQRARQRAMELSNSRGQMGSSFAAGASTRAAIDAAGEIAQQEAMAYRDAATQNMNALNEFALTNLQRATQYDIALADNNTKVKMANMDASLRTAIANLEASTRVDIANLDAETRIGIANQQAALTAAMEKMRIRAEVQMQERSFGHEAAMEGLRQEGRVEIANLDIAARKELAEAGYEHDLNMNELDHEQQKEVNEIIDGYQSRRDAEDRESRRRSEHISHATQAHRDYLNYITAYSDVDMDAAAASRLKADAWNNYVLAMNMINDNFSEFDPILPKKGRG